MEIADLHISDASGVPFYRQIVDQVAQLIRSGQLAPGEQLPSVRDLAGELLVSLITTRRAYADLEHAGLITRKQGQGTFVAETVEKASFEQAVASARTQIREAVGTARRLGLKDRDIRNLVEESLDRSGGNDDA